MAAAIAALFASSQSRDARADIESADEVEERAMDAGKEPSSAGHEGRFVEPAPPVIAIRGGSRACSLRAPVCVSAAPGVAPSVSMRVLGAAERAYVMYVTALGWPMLKAGAGMHLVLQPGEERVLDGPRDLIAEVDRGSVVTFLDARRTERCAAETQAARAVAMHVMARANPALDVVGRYARATSLASLVEPCVDVAERGARAAFFRAHDRGVAAVASEPRAEVPAAGIDAFYTWLDVQRGVRPGATLLAFAALTPTRTEPGAARWNDEPDTFDALRRSFRSTLYREDGEGELLLDFALWRATEATWPALIRDEEALDAHLPWPTGAIAVRPKRAPEPTGASYVLFDTRGAPKTAQLRVEISWETHAKMMWSIVRLDEAGRVLSTHRIPQTTRANAANATAVPLEGAHALLLVGVHTGHPTYQLDPDDQHLEPHAWTLHAAP